MVTKRNSDKDTERDAPDKKHRKPNTTNVTEIISKVAKEDVYMTVVKYELEESRKRPADKDAQLFLETCTKLRSIFADIAELKLQNTDRARQEIVEKRSQGSYLFAVLKKLNRLDKVRLRAGRDALHKEKLTVDSNKLQLQNLLYEADHLHREVQHCRQFKSRDESIELVKVEEFYAAAPKSISRPEKTRNDEHARRLARLEWELQQRKQLAFKCKELQAAKANVAKDIHSKTIRLDSLVPCLDSLLKATRPLQEALGMNVENEWAVQKVARLLPRPLYVAFANLSAYADTTDRLLKVVIDGDEEDAKHPEELEPADEVDDISQDSENDDNDQDNEGERSSLKHHHRRQSGVAITEVNLFKPHPLSVTFKLRSSSDPAKLSISLIYLPALNFVTVRPKLSDFGSKGIAARDVVDQHHILNCLNPNVNDEDDLLNPKTAYTLQEYSINSVKLMEKLTEQRLGKPYKWAQSLCGLDFVTCDESNLITSQETTQATVPQVIQKIRNRLQTRLMLFKQIFALENKNIDELIVATDPVATARVSCSLVQWTSISWNEYSERNNITAKFIDTGLVAANHLFYCAVIIRGSAKLECLISIAPNFPHDMPLWVVSLSWNGVRNAENNAHIREMESYINSVEASPKTSSNILGIQLKRAMTTFDIYLETECAITAGSSETVEFSPEKTFVKAFRGRGHSRPFKSNPNGATVIYTQL